MDYAENLQKSVAYLQSDEAVRSLRADPYWPKWNSTWWHMLLLHEMGATELIPSSIVGVYIQCLKHYSVKHFPIQPDEMPAGVDPYRDCPCHCQLGNVYQVLAARGVDVDRELPWMRPWFLRYQMSDGGLNCDNDAYLVQKEVPSSMVGTIACFEAVLMYTPRPWTAEEIQFLDRAANFLMTRELRLGSATQHNASERESAKLWTELIFPRYYFYDVLRGLSALTLWAEKRGVQLPPQGIQNVVSDLKKRFPSGDVTIGRQGFAGSKTLAQGPTGEWLWGQPASVFPLLLQVSQVGEPSPWLSDHWSDCLERLPAITSEPGI